MGCSGAKNPGTLQPLTLSATAVDAHSIKLDWTAVATAAAYDLRSGSSCPLTTENFAAAQAVPSGPPKPAGTAETATAAGLTSDVTYCFLLKVSDAAGNSTFSNAVSATTRDDRPPAAPTLTALATTPTSITLSWLASGDDESSGTATAQELRYLAGSPCPIGPSNFSAGTLVQTDAPATAGTPQTAQVSGLIQDSPHCFLLKITDKASNSVFSGVLTARTADATAPATPELAVDSSAPPSETLVRLKWTDVGDNGMVGTISRQTLTYWSADFCVQQPATGTTVIEVPVAGPAGTPDGLTLTLQRKTGYCFLLGAYDEVSNGATGAVVHVRTPDLTPPAAPDVSVDALSATSVTLRWTDVGDDDNTGSAQTYMLHASTGAGCATFSAGNLGPIVLAKQAAGAAGTPDDLDVNGLSQGTDYCMAIRVIDTADNATVSNIVSFHTPLLGPGRVTDLRVLIQSSTGIKLTFTEAGRHGSEGTVPGYDVRYATGSNCDSADWYNGTQAQPVPFNAPLTPTGPGSLKFPSASLDVGVPLCFALQAVDGSSRSALSNIARPPARISDLRVTTNDEAGADFAWTAVGDHDVTGTADHYAMVLESAHGGCPSEGFLIAGDFQSVSDVTHVPAPQAAGADQTSNIPHQTPGHAYCASLRTVNADGSASLSNVVSVVNPDTTPPGQPALALAVSPPTADTIPLMITATGDDGTEGAAEYYLVVYHDGCSDPAAFDEVGGRVYTLGPSLPYPLAGSTFPIDAFALTASTDYCFAVYAEDTLGNRSLRSNAITARTAGP